MAGVVMTVLLMTVTPSEPAPTARMAVPVSARPGKRVCRTRQCRRERRWRRIVRPYRAKLNRMARCESTSRWYVNTGNGFYGGLQFTLGTWRWVGGRGYPHHATKLEQMYRAVLLIRKPGGGYGHWPICGYV